MGRGIFNLNQVIFLILGVPTTYLMWLNRFSGDHAAALLVMSIPVAVVYCVAGLGTNYYKLWEFDSVVRVGRFSPYHGLVLGGFGSFLVCICIHPQPAQGLAATDLLRTALVGAAFVGFWNWIYDIHALRSGFMSVYNRPHAAGAGAEAIVTDYAPLHFGLLGAVYGVEVRLVEYFLLAQGRDDLYGWLLGGCILAAVAVPTSVYVTVNCLVHGDSGLWPVHPPAAAASRAQPSDAPAPGAAAPGARTEPKPTTCRGAV